jgi:WD40 repeat protein/DNA-binding XRE family transcriptional regulator
MGRSYRDRDYDFGQKILSLRSAIGLTQTGLAEYLGISRFAIGEWEAGNKYPKAEHLKRLIELAVQQNAFPNGHAADDIRALWKASRQKVLLDERWLSDLLPAPVVPNGQHAVSSTLIGKTRVDWGDALAVPIFYGREYEMNVVTTWIVDKRCQVITLLGMGGIGKSALAIQLMHQVAEQFQVVIWRSLRDLPTCHALMTDLLQMLAPQESGELPDDFDTRLQLLMELFRTQRILLVLDNVESVLEDGEMTGRMRPDFEGFERFLTQVASTHHQSTVLLTTRQKADALQRYEGTQELVRSLRLVALDHVACEHLLAERQVTGTPADQSRLIELYGGNPLALKIVCQTILDLFGGEIALFLEQGGIIFGDVRELLFEQYKRITPLEQQVTFWLTIMREPVSFNQLQSLFTTPLTPAVALDTVNRLYRHSLIERGQTPGSFTLHSVVVEYMTDQILAEMVDEILRGELKTMLHYGLEQAHVKDYLRRTQQRLLVEPLLQRLKILGGRDVEEKLLLLLDKLRDLPEEVQGYGPANLIALLLVLRGHLRGIDLSRLVLRGVYLQGIELQDALLSGAVMQHCDLTQTFDGLTTLTISANGQYWAASSETGQVRLWEAGGHTLYRIWPSEIIYRIGLSPDGKRFAGGTWDGKIKAWDIASGALLWTVGWPEVSQIYNMAFSPDGSMISCVGDDANVRLLDARDGIQLQVLLHEQWVMTAAWHPDCRTLATGDREGVIRLWEMSLTDKTEPATCLYTLNAHTQTIGGMEFSPDGKMLASGSTDGTGKLWNVSDGQLVQTLTGLNDWVGRVRWSPDGRTIASSGRDPIITLWDIERGSYRTTLQGHSSTVRAFAFTPDGQHLVSGSTDGSIRVWDLNTRECLRVMRGHTIALIDADWSPDGRQLVSGGTDHMVTIYPLNPVAPPHVLRGHKASVQSVAWNPQGRWVASAERVNTIRLWDTETDTCIQVIRHPEDIYNAFYYLHWSPDGQRLAVGTGRYGLMIWRLDLQQFEPFDASFPTVVATRPMWSPDGTRVAAAANDSAIYIWNEQGEHLKRLAGHSTYVTTIDWTDDGRYLLSIGSGEAFVWDVEREEVVAKIIEDPDTFIGGEWGANHNTVVTGSADGHLRWWDLETGECLRVQAAHQGTIQSFRKTADRTKLASCSDDGSITVWDLQTGEHLQTVRRDRPYERMDITGIRGLTEAQKETLRQLGAVDDAV